MRHLEGMERRFAPLNDWIYKTLQPYAERIIRDKNRYTLAFDKLEILMSLSSANHPKEITYGGLQIPGAFGYRYRYTNSVPIFQEMEESLSTMKAESPYVKSGIFGDTVEECQQGLEDLKQFIPELHWF